MTDKKDKALKLALKLALPVIEDYERRFYGGCNSSAGNAVREALAEQPAQQQEPVAQQAAGYVAVCEVLEQVGIGVLSRAPSELQIEEMCNAIRTIYTSLQPAPVAKPHEQQDYWQEEARRYAQNADFWRGKYESATAQQQEPVANGLPLVIAGAIFDFAGYLTTRDTVIEVGSTANASPVADLVKDWAALRGLSLADAAVLSWQEWLTDVRANDTSKERVDEMQKQRHDTTPPQPASKPWVGLTESERTAIVDNARSYIEAKLREKNQ